MADRAISELTPVTTVTPDDSFVLEQDSRAKRLTGQVLLTWLADEMDAHGGIRRVEKVSTNVLQDTYAIIYADETRTEFTITNGKGVSSIAKTSTSGLVDTYTITYNDNTRSTFTVTNGAKGDKGDKGDKGNTGNNLTITSVNVQYAKNTSGTVQPTSWQSTIPETSQNECLWTKVTINYSEGNKLEYYTVSKNGLNGTGSVNTVNGKSPNASHDVDLINVTNHVLVVG